MGKSHLSQVLGRATVCVSRLYDANFDFFLKACSFHKIDDECSYQGGNLVTVKHVELAPLIKIEVDETVGIAIQTARALSRFEVSSKLRLDASSDILYWCTLATPSMNIRLSMESRPLIARTIGRTSNA